MTNPSAIDDVKIPSPEFFDTYDTGEFVAPPQVKVQEGARSKYVEFALTLPGEEKVKTRDAQGKALTTQEGYFKIVLEGIKTEGGYEINQTHIGTKQYQKRDKAGNVTGARNSSPFGDFLRANGIDARPASVAEYETLAKATAGRVVRGCLDWSAYDSDNKVSVAEKYEDFPLAESDEQKAEIARLGYVVADGARVPYIERGGKKFWARAGVKRWVSTL